MSVVINELEVVAAPDTPAAPPAVPAGPAAPQAAAPTARDVKLVLRHHLERLGRVSAP